MTRMKKGFLFTTLLGATLSMMSCSDSESYSDRLNVERNATNAYLKTQRVVNDIPADTIFETGEDAPYYRIDPDGNVYMQVINAGDRVNDRAKTSQTVYFRYTRFNLEEWYSTKVLGATDGNETDMSSTPTYFLYKDFTQASSSQWGYGLQLPLNYLGVECEVNLIVKSQFGVTGEISYVQPFLYHVRYFHSQI